MVYRDVKPCHPWRPSLLPLSILSSSTFRQSLRDSGGLERTTDVTPRTGRKGIVFTSDTSDILSPPHRTVSHLQERESRPPTSSEGTLRLVGFSFLVWYSCFPQRRSPAVEWDMFRGRLFGVDSYVSRVVEKWPNWVFNHPVPSGL